MLYRYTFLSSFTFALFAFQINAQRFDAGIKAGGTIAQIDGDDLYGFHQAGFYSTAYVAAKLTTATALEIGLSYCTRGSRYGKDDISRAFFRLNYLEVPVLFVLKDWKNERNDKEFYRMNFFAGLSVGKLISSNSHNGLDKEFNKTDISWILGTTFFWSAHWGVSGQYTRSLNSLYDYSKNNSKIAMTSYFISLGLNYKF